VSFKATLTPAFVRELKGLSKKYASLKKDLSDLLSLLTEDPKQGTALGNNCYKIRMAISSKNKGKSGGARVITYLKIVDEVVYLVSIYDKSDVDTISDDELLSRIKGL
jgi:mRNA-degrading endonuclease RelE of RelBE toxin-antitoxin system